MTMLEGKPKLSDVRAGLQSPGAGRDMYALASEIFPICRSITGDGVRETLKLLGRHISLGIVELPTGTKAFDWVVPKEWNIRGAYIRSSQGETIVDFRQSNLHVLNYSVSINARMTLAELKPHLYSIPEEPDLVPYRTSYYAGEWGFCLPHRQMIGLAEDTYEVVIDSTLENGAMAWGEFYKRGACSDEILLSAHVCHPSLANDNCSGIALLTYFAKQLQHLDTKYSYRILFAPGTIGTIAWLATNQDMAGRIKHGLVVSCVGDRGGPTYKKTRSGDATIDRASALVLKHCGLAPKVIAFSPYGYDERQYNSPGFKLPVGLFQRSQFGMFREYHTSADNLDFIDPASLAQSYDMIVDIIDIIESDATYFSLNPMCEPQLGRRGLYAPIGGQNTTPEQTMALLWVLNQSDGETSLLDIAERSELPFRAIKAAAQRLKDARLIADAATKA